MPRVRSIHLYPYSGWHEIPWGTGRDDSGPFDPSVLDVDAAARTGRRITEALNLRLFEAGVESQRAGYSVRLRAHSESPTVRVASNLRFARDGFIGELKLPRGFHLLRPDQRTTVLLDATRAIVRPLADAEGWAGELDLAADAVRAADYRCGWTSEWKSTRDRKLRARIAVDIADDGYGRWRVQIGDREGAILRETSEMVGWTWIENFQKMAKGMRFRGPRVLEVGTGSRFLYGIASIDLDTAAVIQLGGAEDEAATILSYPGEPGQPTPNVEVTGP